MFLFQFKKYFLFIIFKIKNVVKSTLFVETKFSENVSTKYNFHYIGLINFLN